MICKFSIFLLYVISKHLALSDPSFAAQPNVIRSYRGEPATLRWSLSEPVSSDWKYMELKVLQLPAKTVCTWESGGISYGEGYDTTKITVDIVVGSSVVELIVYNLQPEDVWYNYECTIKYDRFKPAIRNGNGWILLYDVPRTPVITSSPSDVEENRRVTLTCSAESTTIYPKTIASAMKPNIYMEYEWQKDNQKLTTGGRYDVSDNKLTIDKVQRQDNMITYSCIAQESGSKLSNKNGIALDVLHGPYGINIMPSGDIVKIENDSLTLTCHANCNPQCGYRWSKDGTDISDGDKLEFMPISRYNQGTYRCKASNGKGSDQRTDVFVRVHYTPLMSVKVTPSGNIIQGSEVTLTCIVDSRPEPSSTMWTNITVPDQPAIGCSHGNNTHCLLKFSNINILDSGIYQCQADNGIGGSVVTISKSILVYGPPRWYKTDPADFVSGVAVGETNNFTVRVIARPLPNQDQWHWKFSSTDTSNAMTAKPRNVHLMVMGDQAVLSITNVRPSDYGKYYVWTSNEYGGWNEEDLSFVLKPQGPPLKPVNFHVTDVTAVSIRVQWIRGFNGGLEQIFTIRYTNIATGVVREKSGIEDTDGSRQMITDVITDGIEPETEYQLQIIAHNSLGQAVGGNISIVTPVLARLKENPKVEIKDDKAEMYIIITGPLTYIRIENCAEGTQTCVTENVSVAQNEKDEVPTYDVTTEVTLADPAAKSWTFSIWLYDGDFILTSEPNKIHVNRNNGQSIVSIIIGTVIGMLVLFMIIVVLVVLWRKGLLLKEKNHHDQYIKGLDDGNNATSQINAALTCEDEVSPYVTSEDTTEVSAVEVSGTPVSNITSPAIKVGPVTCDIYSEVKKKHEPRLVEEVPKLNRSAFGDAAKIEKTRPASVYPPESEPADTSSGTKGTQIENMSRTSAENIKDKDGKELYADVCKSKHVSERKKKRGDQKMKHSKGNKNGSMPHVNVKKTTVKDGVYSEVEVRRLNNANFCDHMENMSSDDKVKPVVGKDGTIYADLLIFNEPPHDPDKIHGIENLVQYASFNFNSK